MKHLVAVTILVAASTVLASDRPLIPPKGVEGPDVRAIVEPGETEASVCV
jgi:hypothetical protein